MESNLLILLTLSIASIVISIGCCILTIISLLYSIKAHTSVLSMEKSTHTVTYTPIDKEIDKANEEWSTKQSTLEKERKLYSEDIEDNMPEFSMDDDDKKIYSF